MLYFRDNRRGPNISHLSFADGMLLFAEATMEQMDTILECLNYFCAILGQKVSAAKTKLYFSEGVSPTLAKSISHHSGFSITTDFGKYLGVPVIHQRITK